MAATPSNQRSAVAARTPTKKDTVKVYTFAWEGLDRAGKPVRGEMRGPTETVVRNGLRRQGVNVRKIKKISFRGGGRVKDKEVALFTRQLATMVKAGVPMLQCFDIAARSSGNPRFSRILTDVKSDIETGSSLAQAFSKHPAQFDNLYCNLVGAGEQAGILENILERVATYKEKMLALRSKIKSALFYPAVVIAVAVIVMAVIMWFVIPSFKQVFSNFGASLPALTEWVIAVSDAMVNLWWLFAIILIGVPIGLTLLWRRVPAVRNFMDRLILKVPVIGEIMRKATIARWARTLSTMFAAGVPLVDALGTVGNSAGNHVYEVATKQVQKEVSTGTALTVAMDNAQVFPIMALQMTRIGEETGALDDMLSKVAEFYEAEVDDAVAALSSLIEPVLIVFLGVVIGTIVIAMYLPIFKLGSVV